MIKNAISVIFIINQRGEDASQLIGESQPPKKQILITKDSHSMFEYSAKKNIAKVIDEYSTLYPATISASASGRSKGARFDSAKTEIKKIIKEGSSGIQYHTLTFCIATISMRLNEPAQATTGRSVNATETSYEISCAAERSPPRNAYFEFEDHPAPIMP